MKRRISTLLGTLAMSWGMTAIAWGQPTPPPPPPGPIQQAPAPTPAPLPTPTQTPSPAAPTAQNGITVTPGMVNPGTVGSGGTCTPGPVVPGGCIDSCLPKCGFGGTWVVGGGIYYMAPIYNNNRAFITTSAAGASSPTNFHNNLQVAPLAFAGFSFDNGWGIRFRWFQFQENSSTGTTTLDGATGLSDARGNFLGVGPAGTTVAANSHLYLSAYDLEATYNTTIGKWLLIGSAGARYAQINQGYALNIGTITGGSAAEYANHNFNGFGPTLSLEGHRQLGSSGFGLYATARASILFGSGNFSNGITSSAVGLGPLPSAAGNQASVIPVGEMEMGVDWSRAWGRFRFFAQVGVVGQIWWGTGNASDTPVSSTLIGSTGNSNNGSPSNLGFIGGVARAGISF